MARIRSIKPSFWMDDEIAALEPLARLLYIGLWNHADSEGRWKDKPVVIKASILPYDDCDCDALLRLLSDAGFVVRYEADEHRFIQVVNFRTHQIIKNEPPSKIPAPTCGVNEVPHDYRTPPVVLDHGGEGLGGERRGGEWYAQGNDFTPPAPKVSDPKPTPTPMQALAEMLGKEYGITLNSALREKLLLLAEYPDYSERMAYGIKGAAEKARKENRPPAPRLAIAIAQEATAQEIGKKSRKQPKCPACSDTLIFHDKPCDMCDAGRKAIHDATA